MTINRHVHAYEENSCLIANLRNISLKDYIPDHFGPSQVLRLSKDGELCIILMIFLDLFVLFIVLRLSVPVAVAAIVVDILRLFDFILFNSLKDFVILVVQRYPVLGYELEPNKR